MQGVSALLPPLVALACALATRRVALSLLLGVLAGSVIHFGALSSIPSGAERYFLQRTIDPWYLHISGFVLVVLSMVKVTEASQGMAALVEPWTRRYRSRRGVQLATSGLGLVVFFDDYANTLLVGPTMRPLADRYRLSREKLAYLVDSTSAPVAGLAVVSTWVGYEVGLLEQVANSLSITASGYALLLAALPLRFYCLFALALVFINGLLGRDFGPMLRAERAALGTDTVQASEASSSRGPLIWLNAALPIVVLLGGTLFGFVYDGGGFERLRISPDSVLSLGYFRDTLAAAEHGDSVLFYAGLASLLAAILAALASRQLSPRAILATLKGAFRMASGPIAILYCAWALGDVCKDLGTGAVLAEALRGSLPSVLVPLLTFLVAALVSLSTGTSFGTMAILMPAALPLAHELGGGGLFLISAAAVLDGSIFGDHCSPLSDTTLLSSAASECDPLSHVWTQLPYAIAAMLVAAGAYLVTAWVEPSPLWLYLGGSFLLWILMRHVGRPVVATLKS